MFLYGNGHAVSGHLESYDNFVHNLPKLGFEYRSGAAVLIARLKDGDLQVRRPIGRDQPSDFCRITFNFPKQETAVNRALSF